MKGQSGPYVVHTSDGRLRLSEEACCGLSLPELLRSVVTESSPTGVVPTIYGEFPIPFTDLGPFGSTFATVGRSHPRRSLNFLLASDPLADVGEPPDRLRDRIDEVCWQMTLEERRTLRAFLGSDRLRGDAIPGYEKTPRPEAVAALNVALNGQKGLPKLLRQILIAVGADIGGLDLAPKGEPQRVSSRGKRQAPEFFDKPFSAVGLTLGGGYTAGRPGTPGSAPYFFTGPNSLHMADRASGRKTLGQLGAWPWAHAIDGRLPKNWHTGRRWLNAPEFVAPLAAWMREAR